MYMFIKGVSIVIFVADTSSVKVMGRFGLMMLGLFMVVFIVAVLTPKLAKFVDKKIIEPARVKKGIYDFDKDEVRSVYGPQEKEIENGDESDNGKGQ